MWDFLAWVGIVAVVRLSWVIGEAAWKDLADARSHALRRPVPAKPSQPTGDGEPDDRCRPQRTLLELRRETRAEYAWARERVEARIEEGFAYAGVKGRGSDRAAAIARYIAHPWENDTEATLLLNAELRVAEATKHGKEPC